VVIYKLDLHLPTYSFKTQYRSIHTTATPRKTPIQINIRENINPVRLTPSSTHQTFKLTISIATLSFQLPTYPNQLKCLYTLLPTLSTNKDPSIAISDGFVLSAVLRIMLERLVRVGMRVIRTGLVEGK
jgi:hypothetical protein